jgi:hypothetical protein
MPPRAAQPSGDLPSPRLSAHLLSVRLPASWRSCSPRCQPAASGSKSGFAQKPEAPEGASSRPSSEEEAVAILHDESVLRQPARVRLLRFCGSDASGVTHSRGCFLLFCEVVRVVRRGSGVTFGRFGFPLPCVIINVSASGSADYDRAGVRAASHAALSVRQRARGARPTRVRVAGVIR